MNYLNNKHNLTLNNVKDFLAVAQQIYDDHKVGQKFMFSGTGLCLEFKHRMNSEIVGYHIIEYFVPEYDSDLNEHNGDGIYTQERHDFLQKMLDFESPEVLYAVWYQEYKRRNCS